MRTFSRHFICMASLGRWRPSLLGWRPSPLIATSNKKLLVARHLLLVVLPLLLLRSLETALKSWVLLYVVNFDSLEKERMNERFEGPKKDNIKFTTSNERADLFYPI